MENVPVKQFIIFMTLDEYKANVGTQVNVYMQYNISQNISSKRLKLWFRKMVIMSLYIIIKCHISL